MQRGYGEMANRKMYVISGGMIMCDLSNMVCMPVMGSDQHLGLFSGYLHAD